MCGPWLPRSWALPDGISAFASPRERKCGERSVVLFADEPVAGVAFCDPAKLEASGFLAAHDVHHFRAALRGSEDL